LRCSAVLSRFCVFWIRNTIRNVIIVVPVLMTSCQVSEKLNAGPDAAQIMTTAQAAAKVEGRPHWRAVHCAAALNDALIDKDLWVGSSDGPANRLLSQSGLQTRAAVARSQARVGRVP
jgi:hypothetical protein